MKYYLKSNNLNPNFVELADLIDQNKYYKLLEYIEKLSQSDYFELPYPFCKVKTSAIVNVFNNEQTLASLGAIDTSIVQFSKILIQSRLVKVGL